MKYVISALVMTFGLSAAALDVGDAYTLGNKFGRVSYNQQLVELVGATFSHDHDNDVSTAKVLVKAALDTSTVLPGPMTMNDLIEGMREDKKLVAIAYDPDTTMSIVETTSCIGKDFEYTDPDATPEAKTCYKVTPKDIVIK